MKKALLLSLVGWLLAAAPVLAHPPVPANVNFTSERGVPFGLVLDGRPLTRGLAWQVHAGPLQPGQHPSSPKLQCYRALSAGGRDD